jgi:putative FmdB family regulatory protein
MPIYTYRCSNCGVQFDRRQKYEDVPLKQCPECRKKTLHKVISPVGIVFKGSGFYATDHRSPSGMNYSSASNEEKSAEEKSKDSKPKAEKPAEKTAEKPKSGEKEKAKE